MGNRFDRLMAFEFDEWRRTIESLRQQVNEAERLGVKVDTHVNEASLRLVVMGKVLHRTWFRGFDPDTLTQFVDAVTAKVLADFTAAFGDRWAASA